MSMYNSGHGSTETAYKNAAALDREVSKACLYSDDVAFRVDLHKGEMEGKQAVLDIVEVSEVLECLFNLEHHTVMLLRALEKSLEAEGNMSEALKSSRFSHALLTLRRLLRMDQRIA